MKMILVLFFNKEIKKDLIQYCADLGLGIHT